MHKLTYTEDSGELLLHFAESGGTADMYLKAMMSRNKKKERSKIKRERWGRREGGRERER